MDRPRNIDRTLSVAPMMDCTDRFDRYFLHGDRDRFDPRCFRHTGQWWTVFRGVSLAEALSLPETEGIFHPIA